MINDEMRPRERLLFCSPMFGLSSLQDFSLPFLRVTSQVDHHGSFSAFTHDHGFFYGITLESWLIIHGHFHYMANHPW